VNEAQRDLHPRQTLFIKRPLAWGLSATLALCLTGAAFFPEMFFRVPWANSTDIRHTSTHSETTEAKQPLLEREATGRQQGATGFRRRIAYNREGKPQTAIPDAVSDFLAAYGLSDYGSLFFEAMEKDRLDQMAEVIFEETGYQIVQVDSIPDGINHHYGTLRLFSEQTGKASHLLFWKPRVRVTKFYLGYQGEEIRTLEELLMDLRLYDYNLDGIVGPKLMTAVNEFQQEMGLTVTGFPDERIIFLLCHARG
jgi:hypothetical protein